MTFASVTPGRKNPLHLGLPARLRKARVAAKLTPTRLSLLAGLSNPAAALIEGRGQVPRVDTVEKLARVLGVEACWLAFNGEGRRTFRQKIEGGRPAPMPPQPASHEKGPLACEGIAARLAAVRNGRSLSGLALGSAAQLSHTAVANIEAGRSMPGVDVVEQLAIALDVSPCWLAYGVGQGPEEANDQLS